MRNVTYIDPEGRKFLVQLPDDAPDSHAPMGVPIGPPDLSDLNLPLAMEVRLNNALFARQLLTRNDVRRRRQELTAVWQSVLSVDSTVLHNLFEGVVVNASQQ